MRLIDADALKSKVQAQEWKRDPAVMLALDWIYMLINEQPTIDAMPVVRCKECKYYENPRLKVFENCCRKDLLTPMKPNDYCSYGEKMESEGST